MDNSSESRLANGGADLSLCDSNNDPSSAMKKCPATRNTELPTAIRLKKLSMNLSATFFWLIIINFATSAVHCVHSLKNKYGTTITVISAKPCQNALGQFGTCMFMWDCIKSEGVHLGTCSDRFLFGSCCNHNSSLSIESNIGNDSTNQRLGSLTANQSTSTSNFNENPHSRPPPPTTTTETEASAQQAVNMSAGYTKPDRLFLSSQSSSGQADFVTTSTALASNSSSLQSDHVVSLSYDDLPPVQQQQQPSNQVHVPTISSELNSSDYGELPIATTPTTTTTTATSIPTRIQTQDISTATILGANQPIEQSSTLSMNIGSPTHVRPIQQQQQQLQQLNAGEVNQLMAYQLVPRPTTSMMTAPPSSASSSPPTPPTLSDIAQTQRPQQASSWLSRPSLLANAIFHSFKPYLNPNRQRPTYRPYIGGGFRPQHHQQLKPLVMNAHQQQRPTMLLLPNTIHNSLGNNQPAPIMETASSNQAISVTTETSANLTTASSSPLNQDNNDHHIVNPSIMTDRRRPGPAPVDKNNQQHSGNLMSSMPTGGQTATGISGALALNSDDQKQQHQQNQQSSALYEMLGGHASSLASDNSIKTAASYHTHLNTSAPSSNATTVMTDYSIYFNANKTSNQASPAENRQPQSTSPQPSLAYDYNSGGGQHHQFSITNTTFHNHYQKPQLVNNHDHHTTAVTNNESVPNPGYPPLVSSGFLATLPVSDGPIEEIHNIISGSGNLYEQPNKQQESMPPTMGNNNSSLNQTSYIFGPSAISGHNTALTSHTDLRPNISTIVGGNLESDQSRPTPSMVIGSISDTQTTAISLPSIAETSHLQEVNTNFSSATSTATPSHSPPPPQPMPAVTLATSLATPPHHNHHQIPGPSLPGVSGHQREATCGVTGIYPQSKVVGGKNAAFGAWPWQVSVRKVSFFGFVSTHRCGGAVISNEWIATAGHCVEDLALQSIRIRVGEYEFDSTNEPYPHIERNARKKIVHPQYNFYTYENDLALVQLDQPLQFSPHVAPICLPPDNIDLVGRNATVTGWGRLNEGGILPKVLQEVIVPIVSNDKCRDMFLRAGRPEYIPDIFLCAGYEEGGRDSCQGDSGGPLQVKGDDGRWVLAGIISWGIGCAEPLLVGVCSAIQRFKPWIQSTISQAT